MAWTLPNAVVVADMVCVLNYLWRVSRSCMMGARRTHDTFEPCHNGVSQPVASAYAGSINDYCIRSCMRVSYGCRISYHVGSTVRAWILLVLEITDHCLIRRQQDQDREIGCPSPFDSPRSVQGHACATERNRCPAQHDAFWFVPPLSHAAISLSHPPDENRQQLVNAGAIPVLVSLLNSPDTDVQYYCTTALSNIAVDGMCHVVIDDWPRLRRRSCESQEAGSERTEVGGELGATDGQSKSKGAVPGCPRLAESR